jgi:diguanylate cyclase (GGDEF)-like protein
VLVLPRFKDLTERLIAMSEENTRLIAENQKLLKENTQLIAENQKLRLRAEEGTRDELTGVFTSRWLRQWWDTCDRRKVKAVAFIDGDGIKAINDTYGHHVGDAVIRHIADAISTHIKYVVRKGGDEFVAIITDENMRVLESIKASIKNEIVEYPQISVRTSIGVQHSHASMSLHDMLRLADMAMYRAKRCGGGVIVESH